MTGSGVPSLVAGIALRFLPVFLSGCGDWWMDAVADVVDPDWEYDLGYEDGYDEGIDEGIDDGFEAGYDEGYRDAFPVGFDAGSVDGYLKGYGEAGGWSRRGTVPRALIATRRRHGGTGPARGTESGPGRRLRKVNAVRPSPFRGVPPRLRRGRSTSEGSDRGRSSVLQGTSHARSCDSED